MKLAIVCVECGRVAHAPFDDGKLDASRLHTELSWTLSLVDPQEGVLAPLCGPCAEKLKAD